MFNKSGKSIWPLSVSILNFPKDLRDKLNIGLHVVAMCSGKNIIICISHVFPMYLSCILYVSLMYFVCISHVFRMYLPCMLYVFLMYFVCISHVFRVYLSCISCKYKYILLNSYCIELC